MTTIKITLDWTEIPKNTGDKLHDDVGGDDL